MSLFTISRVFDAPRAKVFSMWTTPKHFETWFAPDGCTSKLTYADVRVGGYYEKEECFEGGTPFRVRCLFTEINPIDELTFEVFFVDNDGRHIPHPFLELWPPKLLTRVTFEDEGEGTRLTAYWDPIDATKDQTEYFVGHLHFGQQGWTESLNKLEAELKAIR